MTSLAIIGWASTAIAVVWAMLERARSAKRGADADKARTEADGWRLSNEKLNTTINEMARQREDDRQRFLDVTRDQSELVASCQATVADAIVAASKGDNMDVLQRVARAAVSRLHEMSVAQAAHRDRAGGTVSPAGSSDRAVTVPGGS